MSIEEVMGEYAPFYNRQMLEKVKPMFTGKYQAKIDDRGAVKLPKSFLDYLNECKKSSGVICFVPGNFLRGYPAEDAEELIRNMNKTKNEKNRRATMAFTRLVVKHGVVEYTVGGRIIIPEAIMKISRLSIGENIYIIGFFKYFEIISAEVMGKIEEDAKKNSDLLEALWE